MTHDWSRVGGHPVLDLANTLSWRLDPSRAHDRLADPEALADWALTGGYTDPGGDLGAVRDLRGALVTILDAHLDGAPPPRDALSALGRAYEEALDRAEVTGLPLRWEPADLTGALALAVGDFLREDHPELRRCLGEGCGWLFLDTSRNHSRRWCDPADCGNRTRVRRHAERARATPPAG